MAIRIPAMLVVWVEHLDPPRPCSTRFVVKLLPLGYPIRDHQGIYPK
jgi:hypothetical protein